MPEGGATDAEELLAKRRRRGHGSMVTRLVRKSAADYLQALDHVLSVQFGAPLSEFRPTGMETAVEGPGRRKTLVLSQDGVSRVCLVVVLAISSLAPRCGLLGRLPP